MSLSTDRQAYPRRTSYIIAKYTVREGTFRDLIKNIGAGGLFIRTSRKVAQGQTIVVEFPLFQFEKNVRVTGQVIRRKRDGFAVVFDEPLKGLICDGGEFPEIVHEGDRTIS